MIDVNKNHEIRCTDALWINFVWTQGKRWFQLFLQHHQDFLAQFSWKIPFKKCWVITQILFDIQTYLNIHITLPYGNVDFNYNYKLCLLTKLFFFFFFW